MKFSKVGKPSLERAKGDGTLETIHMPSAGKVYIQAAHPGSATSRDPGQELPHMEVGVDPVYERLNSSSKNVSKKAPKPNITNLAGT